ncbi:hypothetical protein [Phytopseudomonas flavescens]|uniref:hypothetical protein n=1 Tax=Phytopseudomonas flavescens TaxID=29435 RepID=UPI001FC96492|nr:hypothetical protein [Pseudomonas flavescens]
MSLDALIAHDGAREALGVAFKLSGPLGNALIRYLGLFRPDARELTLDRVAKLLGELLPDMQAQRVERNGQIHDAPPAAWVWAIEQSLIARESGRLVTPLKGHGWLYQVISQWQPEAATAVALTGATARLSGRPTSQTANAIAALQERINGG